MSTLKYLQGATFVLKWAVLYPIDAKTSLLKKILYLLWCVYFISTFVITVAQCVIELAIQPFNLIEEKLLVTTTTIYVCLFMNFVIFFYYAQNLVTLVTNISENFLDESDNGIEEISMEGYKKFTDKLPVYWTCSLICSALYTGFGPIFTGTRTLPVPGWFPYNATKSPLYEISFLWQLLCQINLAIIYGSSDIIYPTMTLLIGHQFRILAVNFKNCFYYSLWKCGVPKKIVKEFKTQLENQDLLNLTSRYKQIFDTRERPVFALINVNYLKKNIKHHILLLSYCDDFNQIMNLFLMTKIVTIFFDLLLIIFSVISTGNYEEAVSFATYLTFGFAEIFLYTYGGQILTENADFLWSLYDSPWYLCDVKFQKMFLMVQMRVEKMTYTKAGDYFTLSAQMFLTVLRSIFSYAAVLNEVSGPKQ